MSLQALDLTPFEVAFATLAVFCAAIVRGYTGFGFSMLTVTSLSLLRPPSEVVPIVLLLEIAASAHLLPAVRKHVDWRSLRWLLLGTLLATPIGVWVLSAVPPSSMRALVSALVLVAVGLLWRGFTLERVPGAGPTLATGVVSGLLNGSAAIGGPPVILFYFSSPAGVAVSRASLIAFFLGTDIVASATTAAYGLLTTKVLLRTALLLIPLAAGIAIGNRQFIRSEPASFRRFALLLLLALSLAGLLRAAHG